MLRRWLTSIETTVKFFLEQKKKENKSNKERTKSGKKWRFDRLIEMVKITTNHNRSQCFTFRTIFSWFDAHTKVETRTGSSENPHRYRVSSTEIENESERKSDPRIFTRIQNWSLPHTKNWPHGARKREHRCGRFSAHSSVAQTDEPTPQSTILRQWRNNDSHLVWQFRILWMMRGIGGVDKRLRLWLAQWLMLHLPYAMKMIHAITLIFSIRYSFFLFSSFFFIRRRTFGSVCARERLPQNLQIASSSEV